MSMSSSFVYGFGFHCNFEWEKWIKFIHNHKETFCQSEKEKKLYQDLQECIKNKCDPENIFEDYACQSTEVRGIGASVSNIMSRETGIRFIYCPPDGDCDTLASVVFEQGYPWNWNETERHLTYDKLFDICKKYMDELGIEESPDFLNLEYYG